MTRRQKKLPGCWIWHPRHRRSSNCYVYFRRTFHLASIDDVRRATLHASANAIYRLYVNGVEVGFGPNPSVETIAFYDTYQVARHLKKGRNCIAALAYAYGPEPQGVLRQRGGMGRFYFALTVSRERADDLVIASDSKTRCLVAPQYRRDTPGISWHLGEYKEEVDLRKAVMGWEKTGFNSSKWQQACEISVAAEDDEVELLPREIPLFARRTVLPQNAYAIGFGRTYDCGDAPRWEILGAEVLVAGSARQLDSGDSPLPRIGAGCTVRTLETGGDPTLVVDFGRLANGRLHVHLTAQGGAKVRIGYGESLNVTYVDTYTTRKGRNHISPYGRRHARYVFLTFCDFRRPIEVHDVRFDHITYPVKRVGTFRSSDPLLNRIYEISADTAELCMHDHFEDCPWREQTLYAGDVHVEGLVAATLFGDTKLARKCLRDFARTQRADGAIAPSGPRWNEEDLLIDYVAHYCIALRNYVLYSGDLALGKELFESMQRALGTYLRRINKRGLVEPKVIPRKEYYFIDWYEGSRPLENPVLHALVIGACGAAAELAGWIGREGEAHTYRRHARALRAATNRWFLDARRGVYRDSRRGDRPNTRTTRTNAILSLYGVPTKRVAQNVRRFIRDEGIDGLPRTPYFNFFVGCALGETGTGDDLLWLLRSYWGEMVRRGAVSCWEAFDATSPSGKLPDKLWSLCHAWSAGPGFLLPAYVLGVSPVEPGWRRITFNPNLGGLEFAEGTIPTPYGTIEVLLKKDRKPRIRTPRCITVCKT